MQATPCLPLRGDLLNGSTGGVVPAQSAEEGVYPSPLGPPRLDRANQLYRVYHSGA
jgi:hypothetical protein